LIVSLTQTVFVFIRDALDADAGVLEETP